MISDNPNMRRPAFAGSWYPAGADECEVQIEAMTAGRKPAIPSEAPWIGGIVPHAGWFFSGDIAAAVIRDLAAFRPDLAIVFGMHMQPSDAPRIMTGGAWWTPFGPVPVAADIAGELASRCGAVRETPEKFIQDNTIELQLPLIRYFLPDAEIIGIGVPPAPRTLELVEELVSLLDDENRRAVFIGSTDLTHYGPNYRFSPRGPAAEALDWVRDIHDRRFVQALLDMDPESVIQEGVRQHNACCAGAAAAALYGAMKRGAKTARETAYATSHDRHPSDSFVGYLGMLFA